MTSSKIEDVARAIDGKLWNEIDMMEKYAVGGIETMASQKSESLAIARRAIKAMRNTDEAMSRAALDKIAPFMGEQNHDMLVFHTGWRAAIDAAISESVP